MNYSIALGSGQTGLTLKAQLVDSTGTNVGSPITTGFTEIGAGNYLWAASGIAPSFQGGVIFKKADNTVMAFSEVNPEGQELKSDALDSIMIEDGVNARQALSAIGAALAGVLQLTGTNTITIQGMGTSTPRITAIVTGDGQRRTVTLNLPE